VTEVQLAEQVQRVALARGELRRRQEVQHRRPLVAQARGLEGGREETVAVIRRAAERPGVEEQHVPGEVLVLRP
jgi:hypothetical protein